MRKSLLALVLLASASLAHAAVQLKDGHPSRYTVVKGDTLWDISGKFLERPWKWPELWHANPQIKTPHLIYPGDTLTLMYVNGEPRLVLERGTSRGTIKLSPTVRRTPIAEAIPTIPLETINSFLIKNRILNNVEELEQAPYIVAGNAERVISGVYDRVYARGDFDENSEPVYGIYRQGKVYNDPETGVLLGINADDIGSVERVAVAEDIGTFIVRRTTQEIRNGDRLLHTEERAINSTFTPSEPKTEIEGLIIDVPRGVSQIGQFDVVTLNKGRLDGLEEGNTLAIYRTGETIRDRIKGDSIKMPDERAGLLMVFRVYDNLSYGLVLQASRQLSLMDKVRNP